MGGFLSTREGISGGYIMHNNYWSNKEKLADLAEKHTDQMSEKYPREIDRCVKNTVLYQFPLEQETAQKKNETRKMKLANLDSVSAIFSMSHGKTAVLNFASYKNPGGMFLQGSQAQEESLCHASFLYNVLKKFDGEGRYYYYNRQHLNHAMYLDRALYTPDVLFFQDDRKILCDVITCAAPNLSAASRFRQVTPADNYRALNSRCRFILQLADIQQVDTLILGAYGCGVFGQDPKMVAGCFIRELQFYGRGIKRVIFAVPSGVHNRNYLAFKEVFADIAKKQEQET